MIAIIVDHTKIYYAEANATDYYLYVYNALTIFFFLSGYLFFNEGSDFSPYHKLKSICRRLVIPYFLFTPILSLSKVIAGQQQLSSQLFISIFSGEPSWFVSTLVTASLLFCLLLVITCRHIVFMAPLVAGFYLLYFILPDTLPDFWHYHHATRFLLYLFLGYSYHLVEHKIPNSPYLTLLLFLGVFVSKYLYIKEYIVSTWAMEVYLLADTMLCIMLAVNIAQTIKGQSFIEWIGRKSIYFYFLCGGVPFVVSLLMNQIGLPYNNQLSHLLLCIAVTLSTISLVIWLLNYFLKNKTAF